VANFEEARFFTGLDLVARPRQFHRDLARHAGRTLREHDDTITHVSRLLDVVGDEDAGLAVAARDAKQQILQVCSGLCVNRRERLVEQQQARARREPSRDRDALLHATGQLPGIVPLEAGKPNGVQQRHGMLGLLGGGLMLDAVHAEQDIAEIGLPRQQRAAVVLEDDRHAFRGAAANRGAREPHDTAIGCQQARKRQQQRGLATPRRPDDRNELAFAHAKTDAGQHLDARRSSEGLAKCLDSEQRRRRRRSRPGSGARCHRILYAHRIDLRSEQLR
jgi:hypothetical protein